MRGLGFRFEVLRRGPGLRVQGFQFLRCGVWGLGFGFRHLVFCAFGAGEELEFSLGFTERLF